MFNTKCKSAHWHIKDGQLFLETADKKHSELAKSVITVLERQIRQKIYDDICSWEPISNRAQILKISGGLDNALLGVQAICADIALGKKDDTD